jgi:hypothetical protein
MKPLTRRSVTTGMVAAVTAIPAVTPSVSARADTRADKLLATIRRYRAEINAVNASHGLTDEVIDACIDRADAILVEAVGPPVLTTASAMAVISLFIDDVWMLSQHSVYGDAFLALAKAVRDYIGDKVQS